MVKYRKGSNYKGFEKALDIDFGHQPPENKEELKILMRGYKYRVKNNEKELPTDKQVNFAWEYLNKKYISQQKTIYHNYRVESYRNTNIYRATDNTYYNGKLYKKGQFIPKQK